MYFFLSFYSFLCHFSLNQFFPLPRLDSKLIQEGCSVKASHREVFHLVLTFCQRIYSTLVLKVKWGVIIFLKSGLSFESPDAETGTPDKRVVPLSSDTVFTLCRCVFGLCLFFPRSLSLSLPRPRYVSTIPSLGTTLPLSCVHSSLRLGSSVYVCVRGCVSHLRIGVSRELV